MSITSSAGIANVDAGERHLDRRQRDGGTGGVAEDARQLDEPAERIAHQTERALLRERDGVTDLRGRAAEHLGRRAGRHRRGGAGLRLAAALGAGQRRALGDHGADEPRGGERVDDRVVATSRARRRGR